MKRFYYDLLTYYFTRAGVTVNKGKHKFQFHSIMYSRSRRMVDLALAKDDKKTMIIIERMIMAIIKGLRL